MHRKWCRYLGHSTLRHGQPCKGEPRLIPESTSNNSCVAVQLARIGATAPVALVARQRPGQDREMVGSWQFIPGGRSGCEGKALVTAAGWSPRKGNVRQQVCTWEAQRAIP